MTVRETEEKKQMIISASSCHAISMDIPDPLSPPLPIVHCFRQVFRATSVSAQSCCIYVITGRPAFAPPCERVHRSKFLMSSSLLLQQCPACLVRLILIVFVMGGRQPYSCCFVRCCLHELFSLLAAFLCSCRPAFFSMHSRGDLSVSAIVEGN